MEYNKRLMNSSIMGDDDALDELKFNAGSGDCEAQYYLAIYYKETSRSVHDPDYQYWLEKSNSNRNMNLVDEKKTVAYVDSTYYQGIFNRKNVMVLSHLITLFLYWLKQLLES